MIIFSSQVHNYINWIFIESITIVNQCVGGKKKYAKIDGPEFETNVSHSFS